ncbi:tRNA pseudouridine(13) synthase TruD [Pseudoxanthomonas sacheonensis]|uniref:tRNA pseudouridine synthase D n=1 Tax=Pseudoxanthomonas sacheonensis TaxID=443615 RepID=A0ABU1RUJ2_9GAMM|nr:tRNA pseudouridine(13) synthase TruD [Pseudoxanthomonas sacheonensis]MDR6842436.1 tRNA pseudouridine13 synthase [Pseudoxanthomonas sacheonensis]
MTQPLPSAFGAAVLSARIRTTVEDFFVEEIAGFEPSGEGEHLLLTIEKRGLNTAAVAKRLADWAGLPEMAIGYAGMKDRHAVTRQRFSVHLPKRIAPDPMRLQSEDLEVLSSTWHNRKLPRGALAGNRFVLVLRDVTGERALIEERLRQIAARGLPNWFGEQRFGRGGDNVESALSMFAGRRVRHDQRSILLSAARSELFNRVLAARVRDASWDAGLEGEVWILAGSRSVFGPEPWDETLADRLARFDIHPSGPLWGAGEPRSTARCAEVERAALDGEDGLMFRKGLEDAGLKQERRALRLVAEGLTWTWLDEAVLSLSFSLPPGSYATALLQELGEITDAARN